jgi:predicted ATPase
VRAVGGSSSRTGRRTRGPPSFSSTGSKATGATRVTLGPLDAEAQIALIGDVLGAVPDATLIQLAADAAGNPFMLAEAFLGLLDEDAITVAGRPACGTRPPS